jgi:hypothetical protein
MSALIGDDPPEYGKTYKQPDLGLRILQNIMQMRNNAKSESASQCTKTNDIRSELLQRCPILLDYTHGAVAYPAHNRIPKRLTGCLMPMLTLTLY